MSRIVGIYGLGSIGSAIANSLGTRGIEMAFAVDNDPNKVGKELGSVGGPKGTGLVVSETLDPDAARSCDVVLHSTGSRLAQVFPQIAELLECGCNIISTCEELSYPYLKHPDLARKIDSMARDRRATVLGTGVNPGFLLDALPAFICKACASVESIEVSRIVEASSRREPLQRKIGLGMDPRTFEEKARQGLIGHIGLFESCGLVAEAVGWELSELRQEISPVLADGEMETSHFRIGAGQVRGIRQEAVGIADGGRIKLFLEMAVQAGNPADSLLIRGDPPISLTIPGGVNGDRATVARVINNIEEVAAAPSGLATVLSLPLHSRKPGLTRQRSPRLIGSARLL